MKQYRVATIFLFFGFSFLYGMEEELPIRDYVTKLQKIGFISANQESYCKALARLIKPVIVASGKELTSPEFQGSGLAFYKPAPFLFEINDDGYIDIHSWEPKQRVEDDFFSCWSPFIRDNMKRHMKSTQYLETIPIGATIIREGVIICSALCKKSYAFSIIIAQIPDFLTMPYEQFELLMGISQAMEDTLALRKAGIKNQRARVHANTKQMETFRALPVEMREELHYYIVDDSPQGCSVQ